MEQKTSFLDVFLPLLGTVFFGALFFEADDSWNELLTAIIAVICLIDFVVNLGEALKDASQAFGFATIACLVIGLYFVMGSFVFGHDDPYLGAIFLTIGIVALAFFALFVVIATDGDDVETLTAAEFRAMIKKNLTDAGYYWRKLMNAEIHPYANDGEEDFQVSFYDHEAGEVEFVLSEAVCAGTWKFETNDHEVGVYKWEKWGFVIDLTARKVKKVYANKK